jgi:hypothetical protein
MYGIRKGERGLAVKRFRLSAAALAVAALVAAMVASAAYGIANDDDTGGLSATSCISDGGGSCADVLGIDEPLGIALSDDESRMFVAAHSSNGVSVFRRDKETGKLTQLDLGQGGCTNETGANGCFDGAGLVGPTGVASVENNAYVVSDGTGAIATISRTEGESGRWEPRGCISEGGADGCTSGRGLAGANAVAISPDKATVYVGGPGSIAIFKRNKSGGALTQLSGTSGCVNTTGADGCATTPYLPDTVQDLTMQKRKGNFLYVAASSPGNGAVLVFSRDKSGVLGSVTCYNDAGTNGCVDVTVPFLKPMGLAIDVDQGGLNLYVAANGSNAVAYFSRNKDTGALTTIGCASQGGSGGCTSATAMTAPTKLVVYKTNRYVYVTAGDGVAEFSRDKHTGVLTQLAGADACISQSGGGGCAQGEGLGGTTDILTTGGGKHAYVSGATADSVVTLRQH